MSLNEIEARHKRTVAIPGPVCRTCNQLWPCDAARLVARMKVVRGKVMMIDASPAGSLNAQLKAEALALVEGE